MGESKGKQTLRQRRRYHERVKAGICTRCDEPARPGRIFCAHHAELWAAYIQARYRRMRDALKKVEAGAR